ncbi:hypothetical protein G7046_g5203 [Stylonectria norvegica]|nr:hypothetical protein G7046_g5203 [Stylonectria norvegica]
MDLDIEMDDAFDTAQDAPIVDLGRDDILQPDEQEEPGELADDEPTMDESQNVIPMKLHVRGLDTLHTSDIKAYVKSHYGIVDKVEWIDDSSANLVFSSESTARDAITALSTVHVADPSALAPGETLPAKPLEGRPEITMHIRFAVEGDRKQAGAALRSRYYLLHPEHDPEERRRRQQENRSRYRDRDGEFRRSSGRRRRDSDDEVETFEASMYDDEPRATRQPDLVSPPHGRPRLSSSANRGKELFASRKSTRDRSASPGRSTNGDDSMSERASSSRNRTQARSIKDRISADNSAKELFPTQAPRGRGGQLDQLERAIGSARLKEEDRPKIVSVPADPTAGAFSIRGTASQRGDGGGFAIKGAAAGASARELFPDRFGGVNVGKELFDGSRSKRRQKAEDLFL